MKNDHLEWINYLGLTAHPEGGYFREVYRNKNLISDEELIQNYLGKRNLATSIYYMLKSGQVSKLHRLKSDEIWYFHYGAPLRVHIFTNSEYFNCIMGTEYQSGHLLQLVIPAGAIFGAEVVASDSYCIIGCMVSPGFHYDDFEMVPRNEMVARFPEQEIIIRKLT